MITVKKVFEKEDKSVFQAYEDRVLGEVIVCKNKILSCAMTEMKNEALVRDFLLRSVVFLLTDDFDRVEIGYKDAYFETLGFIYDGEGMSQESKKIVFPSSCCGHK